MITWIVLTRGDRPSELAAALASIRSQRGVARTVVVANGGRVDLGEHDGDVEVIELGDNIGVPGGRAVGVAASDTDVVAFLDDDAELLDVRTNELIDRAFDSDAQLGAISFRIHDGSGTSDRRHVPRLGRAGVTRAGPAATFLGGASAIRRSAYERAGGYWSELFYAHEELDLSWRLHEEGFTVSYRPDVCVMHPPTAISRHPAGWYLTGRNRVWIARRNLPLPVLAVHVIVWLCLGLVRAPDAACRRRYLSGWRAGWSGWGGDVIRRPLRWSTIGRLARAGRPPIV